MATVLALLAKERGDVMFARQVLSYPVGQASFDHGSYQQLAEGYYLRHDGMPHDLDNRDPEPWRSDSHGERPPVDGVVGATVSSSVGQVCPTRSSYAVDGSDEEAVAAARR
jgi:acetyl esterase/lipase